MNIPYISAEEVRKNLSMEDAIQCTENVYKLKSQDKTVVWPTIFYEFDPGHAEWILNPVICRNSIFSATRRLRSWKQMCKKACRILWV